MKNENEFNVLGVKFRGFIKPAAKAPRKKTVRKQKVNGK